MDIEVTIDRLVLDGMGVDAHTAALVAAAVETELAGRLAAGPLDTDMRPAAVPVLRTAPVQVREGASPQALGRGIAAAVLGGLRHG
jgi:hypothetical protein